MKAFRFGVVAAAQEGGATWRDIARRAEDLGYSETSAFHRAFRRAFGVTPGDVRLAAHRVSPVLVGTVMLGGRQQRVLLEY